MKENGYEYVDLGLPSGTMWATCNVGADKPEDFGLLFQFGRLMVISSVHTISLEQKIKIKEILAVKIYH